MATGTNARQALAERAAVELAEASAEEVVRWAVETFGSRLAVASSMEDAVLVHLASRVAPGIDVVFLDTGYHFAETLATRDEAGKYYDIRLVTVTPQQSVAEQDAEYGPNLYARDPDRCCALRKVDPLARVLAGYDAWATGMRREDASTRAEIPLVGWDERRGKVKINPLAAWTSTDVQAYAQRHAVVLNPLLHQGYASIGCAPCTQRVAPGEQARAGRWSDTGKTECGIHL